MAVINGTPGNDTLQGTFEEDQITAGAGDDLVSGEGDDDLIDGGEGNDVIFGDVPNTDLLAESEGIDLPPGSGWFVYEALEAGESSSSPNWESERHLDFTDFRCWEARNVGGGPRRPRLHRPPR